MTPPPNAAQALTVAKQALEELHRLTKSQSDAFLLRLNTLAVTALDQIASLTEETGGE